MSTNVIIIPDESLFVPSRLGKLIITHDDQKFSVIDSKGLKSDIQRADLDKDLRDVSSETLKKMTDVGYLSINERGTDYALKYNVRGLGGEEPHRIEIMSREESHRLAVDAGVGTFVAGATMFATGKAIEPIGGEFKKAGDSLITAGKSTMYTAPTVYLSLRSRPSS